MYVWNILYYTFYFINVIPPFRDVIHEFGYFLDVIDHVKFKR